MLSHLRQHVVQTLAQTHRVLLSTYGPADIQTGEFSCVARGTRLYLRVPHSSDHLFNLENHDQVVIFAQGWNLRGVARILAAGDAPPDLALDDKDNLRWASLVEVRPTRIQFAEAQGCLGDTIDVDE